MKNFIIFGLIFFLLYTNSSFRSYTIEGLQVITTFIKEFPKEEKIEDEQIEIKKNNQEGSGFSTY
tara:strand:+ start:814 stop:1008 length:195 start_codon:yes stop_codon:yes gene_type:complete